MKKKTRILIKTIITTILTIGLVLGILYLGIIIGKVKNEGLVELTTINENFKPKKTKS